jgi:hypothetical protein
MNQQTIDQAVNITTKQALNGTPVSKITWISPPATSSNPKGTFVVEIADLGAGDTTPWEM